MAYETAAENEELVQEQDRGSDMAESGYGQRKRRGRRPRGSRLQEAAGRSSGEALPTVQFRAILASSGDPIKVGQDGESKVQMEVSASDIAEVLKLILYLGRLFTVTISTE